MFTMCSTMTLNRHKRVNEWIRSFQFKRSMELTLIHVARIPQKVEKELALVTTLNQNIRSLRLTTSNLLAVDKHHGRFKSLNKSEEEWNFSLGEENTPSSISSKLKRRQRASITLAKKCSMHDSNLPSSALTRKVYQIRWYQVPTFSISSSL